MTGVADVLIVAGIAAALAGLALWRDRRETRAVERALYLELVPLRAQAALMAAEIARRHAARQWLGDDFFQLWRLSTPLIYPALGSRLGRLRGDALDRVGYFHAQLADARTRLAEARAASGFRPTPYRMLSALVRACSHVEPWVRDRERRFGRVEAVDWPDLRAANEMLGEFEDGGEEPIVAAYCWTDCAHALDRSDEPAG